MKITVISVDQMIKDAKKADQDRYTQMRDGKFEGAIPETYGNTSNSNSCFLGSDMKKDASNG